MRAILHIGTEKTGTTSFQAFMHHNRARLRDHGILYPEDLGHENHRFVATYGLSLETADEFVRGLGITTAEQMEDFYRTVEDRLRRQVDAAKAQGIGVAILSSEHLHSRLRSPAQIARIRDLLDPLFDEIEVHVHLRPQVDVMVSLASTQSRVGGTVRRSFFEAARTDQFYYNYDLLVGAWESVFGPENLRCTAFKANPDFLAFIGRNLGFDPDQFETVRRANEALDVRVMAMVNALVDSNTPQRIDFRLLDLLPVEQKLQLDETTARRVQHPFEESNRALIARRADLQPGQLQPDWTRYSGEGNLHVLETPCSFSKPLAQLLSHYDALIAGRATL